MAGVHARQSQLSVLTTSPLESYLESLRAQTGIPGMSAALVQDGEIVWERGFGFQNLESRVRATPDTPYPIADISQTIAAVLVLQCAEERRLELDDPVRRYGGVVPEQSATLRQVLSHTSAGAPGESFHYDPERYSQLTPVVETCIPQPYRKSVAVNVLERLAMKDSVPGRDLIDPNVLPEPLFATEILERYRRVLDRIAIPYKVDKRGRATRNELSPEGINAATGLVTTVRDFARFDAALDETVLLKEDTLGVAWSRRHQLAADVAAHRTRVVRPELSRRARRLALRTHRQRLLVARREAPIPSSDVHPVRQQRGPERAIPARRRRRHAITLCDALPPPLYVGPRCGRTSEPWLSSEFLSDACPEPRARTGSSRRFSASPSRATRRCSITSKPRARSTGAVGGSVTLLGAGPLGVEGLVVYTPGFFQQDNRSAPS